MAMGLDIIKFSHSIEQSLVGNIRNNVIGALNFLNLKEVNNFADGEYWHP